MLFGDALPDDVPSEFNCQEKKAQIFSRRDSNGDGAYLLGNAVSLEALTSTKTNDPYATVCCTIENRIIPAFFCFRRKADRFTLARSLWTSEHEICNQELE